MSLIKTRDWFYTSQDEPRGYIVPHTLQELWFHVGTACNLKCPFCLEGSKPGDTRLQAMTLHDVEPYIHQALELGVERFSFTGGEPFVFKDFVNILQFASQHRPCLVLTNGTKPVLRRLHQISQLSNSNFPISFRVSIDHPDENKHDAGRGPNSYNEAMQGIKQLSGLGFDVSVARQMAKDEDSSDMAEAYKQIFSDHGIKQDTHLVAFPDFSTPYTEQNTPEVTENCMTQYQSDEGRKSFMCAYSKMLVKIQGKMRVYACTLVDDNIGYDLGDELSESMKQKIMLKHHRCYSCFAYGASCSG